MALYHDYTFAHVNILYKTTKQQKNRLYAIIKYVLLEELKII